MAEKFTLVVPLLKMSGPVTAPALPLTMVLSKFRRPPLARMPPPLPAEKFPLIVQF